MASDGPMLLGVLASSALWFGGAAQGFPLSDDDWADFPEEGASAPVVAPRATPERATPPVSPPAPASGEGEVEGRGEGLENRVSIFGAQALGPMRRGLGLYLGFPLLGGRALLGVTPSLDLGIGFDSLYGAMNEVRALARWRALRWERWSGALVLDLGWAFFNQPPSAEGGGGRWVTGRRDFNVLPGFVVSHQGEGARGTRLFVDVRYHLALDRQPYQVNPLGGVPAALQLGHNLALRAGAEMPFSPRTSFLFLLGFDVHGRREDATFMPACFVGMVTGL